MSSLENHKPLKFRDKNAVVSRFLLGISICIFIIAVTLISFAIRKNLTKQAEMTRLIGLAEAQGGDIGVARQIYDAIQKVEKLTKLPEGEIPVFATIGDVAKLATQPIFKDAMNGDQVLLYTKSQWIYIYRPKINKLVAQGPFALPSPSPQPQAQPQPQMQPQAPPPGEDEPPTQPLPDSPPAESASPEGKMSN